MLRGLCVDDVRDIHTALVLPEAEELVSAVDESIAYIESSLGLLKGRPSGGRRVLEPARMLWYSSLVRNGKYRLRITPEGAM